MSLSHRTKLLMPAVLLTVALGIPGCGRNASPVASQTPAPSEVSQSAADDIAAQIGVTLARDFGSGRGTVASLVEARPGGALAATRTVTDSSSGSLTYSVVVTFYDANGQEQETYDPETTVRLALERRVRGTHRTPELEARMGSRANLDIHGVGFHQDRLTSNGSSNDTLESRFQARDGHASQDYHLLSRGALVDVVQLKPTEQYPWPLSGRLTLDVEADRLDVSDAGRVEAHYESHLEVRFNGTAYPEIEFEEGWRYRVDLRTGEVERL